MNCLLHTWISGEFAINESLNLWQAIDFSTLCGAIHLKMSLNTNCLGREEENMNPHFTFIPLVDASIQSGLQRVEQGPDSLAVQGFPTGKPW